jgi:homoserine kinase
VSAPPDAGARVRVPASTSNLGAGFDCVGFAVDLWLEARVTVEAAAPRRGGAVVEMRRGGTLAALDAPPHEDLAHVGFAALCAHRGRPVPERVRYALTSQIPVARGLGSSSAALVAGAALANEALALGCAPSEIADVCARIEGHPDNVAPAVFGGAVLGVPLPGDGGGAGYAFARLAVHDSIAFAFAVPGFQITTSAARAILPRTIDHRTAVAAAAKSAALVQGLAGGDRALLAHALADVLHVPFRRALVRGYDEVEAAAAAAGAFGATLSGSGSTMMAVGPAARAEAIAAAMREGWRACGVEATAFVQRRPAAACLRSE